MDKIISCIEKDKFDSITIFEENIDELEKVIRSYFDKPKHLIINLNMSDDLSDEYLDSLNFLSTILKSENYCVELFSPTDKVANKLNCHRFRNIPEISNLTNFLSKLTSIEKELRIHSLLKSYVDELMKLSFSKGSLIVQRGELSIRDGGTLFLHEMNYYQTFELEDSFFSFVITAPKDFFEDFLKALKTNELKDILDTIGEKVPQELLENVTAHKFCSHLYKDFPTEKINKNESSHNYFSNSSVMVIPLKCSLGEFNLEVWIPKQFATSVYKFLNP